MNRKRIAAMAIVAAVSGLFGTGVANAEALDGHYGTNPNNGIGKNTTITIDGSFNDWSEDMMIAKGVANDDPRIFRGSHEGPVYDTYALYSAWDDENLYFMWQYTNVTDVVDPAQQYPISDNGKPYNGDIPIMLALNTGSGNTTDGTASDGKPVWGLDVKFTTDVDTVLCFSTKPGVGQPAIFKAVNGKLDYDSCVGFKKAGVEYKYGDGFLGSTMDGIKGNGYSGYTPADLLSSSSNWVNFLNEGHNTSQDTMYEMKIPLSALGITRDYLENNGIGAMLISTFGASGIGSLPMDMAFLDNATQPYSFDESTSAEKEDSDNVTVPLAKIGAMNQVINPIKSPVISSLEADKVSPQKTGTAIKFDTEASGGTGSLSYQYEINGEVVKAYDSQSDYTWTPSTAGTYTVKVTVKDANNKTATKQTSYVIEKSDTPINPLTISNLNTNVTSPQILGNTISVSAAANGGNGSLQYKFIVNDGSVVTTLSDYSSNSTVTWTPSKVGTYVLTVYVKDSNGSLATKSTNYVIEPQTDIPATTIKANVASPQDVGTTVKFTTEVESSKTLSYKYWVYDDEGNWTAISDYSESNSVDWTPNKVGNYIIWVDVKDDEDNVESYQINYVVNEKPEYIEENDSRVLYLGAWNTAESTDYSNGQIFYTDSIGAKAAVQFYGTGIKLISTLGTDRGIAKVTLDGKVYSADMFRSSLINKGVAFQKLDLEEGIHTISVECSGLSSRKSSGTIISVDAFGIIK